MQTGEDTQALRKIIDLIRFASIIVLMLHFYEYCHDAIRSWGIALPLIDRIVHNMVNSIPLLGGAFTAKSVCLILLCITLIGAKGKKDEKLRIGALIFTAILGIILFFIPPSAVEFFHKPQKRATVYIMITAIGYLAVLDSGTKLSRTIRLKTLDDIFNEKNQTFNQQEEIVENEYSFHFPATYNLRAKIRNSIVSIPNPHRTIIVLGSAGAGKTVAVFRPIISQALAKAQTMFVYDFKYPDLSIIAYNHALKNAHRFKTPPKFYVIDFDDVNRSHRCNPLLPSMLLDMTDAAEASRTIMLSLNREFLKKQGDFFVESAINFTTAIFWFLKKYRGGIYCTLPHAIELAQVDYKELFAIMALEPELDALINVFYSAFARGAAEQLEGQIASAKIGLARLVSPTLYFVLTGNEFTLDLNNPDSPKIICMGNNPFRQQIYGAVLSLYIERMLKVVNKAGQLPSCLLFDEAASITVQNLDHHIATSRSRLCANVLGYQDVSQLKRDYGKDQAEVIMNSAGNIIAGQCFADTAKMLSERIGKIMQERESLSINANDTSISKSTQLESAVPPSVISNLSSCEFVGAVADSPQQKIKHKAFHCQFTVDFDAIRNEQAEYKTIPNIREISQEEIMYNFHQVKQDIRELVAHEIDIIKSAKPPADKKNSNSQSF